MNKLIGLVTGIYVEEWIEPSIQQALNYCDEVIVSIGAHSQKLAVLKDCTLERAQKYSDQVKFVPTAASNSFVGGRGVTLNRMMEAAGAEVGDWLWLLDADEFYFEQTACRVREMMETDFATVSIASKFFFLNMTRYLRASHVRLYRVTHQGAHFTPSGSQSWSGKGDRGSIGFDPDDEQSAMFHYSLLTAPRYRKLQWDTEFGQKTGKVRNTQDKKLLWLNEIYLKYELEREDYWTDKNTELMGFDKRTPLWTPSYKPQPGGRLWRYDGPQPLVIEEAGLHLVTDFRTFRD